MRILNNFILFLALSCTAISCAGSDESKNFIEHTPLELSELISCGTWEDGGKSGHLRFIYAETPEWSAYYLQWVEVTHFEHALPSARILKTEKIEEYFSHGADHEHIDSQCVRESKSEYIRIINRNNDKNEVSFGKLRATENLGYEIRLESSGNIETPPE